MRPLGFRPGLRAFGHPNFFESACLPQCPEYGLSVGAAFGESLMPGGKYTCHAAYRRTDTLRRKCLRVQEGAQQKIVAYNGARPLAVLRREAADVDGATSMLDAPPSREVSKVIAL